MQLRLVPLPFFAGFALGLAALSWLGANLQSNRLIENFIRFHQFLGVESGYFATARQVKAIVERPVRPEPAVTVIIGGSSVLNGVFQHESLLWSRFLEEELGSRFRVINLAQRAGSSAEFGNIAAELLLAQSRPVIFIGDATILSFIVPLEHTVYSHIMLDAWNRGYLLPWLPRDERFSHLVRRAPANLHRAALAASLDRYLNFNDLWNFVAYEYAGTIWSPLLAERSFLPRSQLADPEGMPAYYAGKRYSHDMQEALRIVRDQIMDPDNTTWNTIWRSLAEETDQLVPLQLRAVTLAVIYLNSPYYLDRVTPDERSAFIAQANRLAELLQNMGFNRALVPTRDFTEDDYVDRVHLSVSGGKKLATALAPAIRRMATELGYTP